MVRYHIMNSRARAFFVELVRYFSVSPLQLRRAVSFQFGSSYAVTLSFDCKNMRIFQAVVLGIWSLLVASSNANNTTNGTDGMDGNVTNVPPPPTHYTPSTVPQCAVSIYVLWKNKTDKV